ncbi:MAG: YifB family Mg chelatase-like AAA ATPase [Eubacteriales bacterium]|nr:YifB family Mg chelatase-like AAA ATPase [Eubacteriales bacterium]
MFAKIKSAGLQGMDGFPVDIEADVINGIPGFVISGALSTETREAQARVWNAVKNIGTFMEPKKIIVNLSPASVRKEGTAFDLGIAVAVICGYGVVNYKKLQDTAFLGELGLDGSLKSIRGTLSLAFSLKACGIRRLVLPYANAAEASLVEELEVFGCSDIREVLGLLYELTDGRELRSFRESLPSPIKEVQEGAYTDFSEVRGQHMLKRAAEIAVSGRHNLLMSGPAGTGKTLIAKCMPGIMPELTREEDIEISKVYSICGLLPEGQPLIGARPFRSPHHGITEAAFAGGGMRVLPGELSLASGGILFLDELPLFNRNVLEILRQPLEDHRITVSRLYGSFKYPADFILVGAMNNCACGFYPGPKCTCTRAQIKAYSGRLSKPLMERIDICAEANPVKVDELVGKRVQKEEGSAAIRQRVEAMYALQAERFKNEEVKFNSRMGIKEIERYCVLGKTETDFMKDIYSRKGLSGRTYHKILKVARTIADMDGCGDISVEHLAEAVEMRSIEDRVFGRQVGDE